MEKIIEKFAKKQEIGCLLMTFVLLFMYSLALGSIEVIILDIELPNNVSRGALWVLPLGVVFLLSVPLWEENMKLSLTKKNIMATIVSLFFMISAVNVFAWGISRNFVLGHKFLEIGPSFDVGEMILFSTAGFVFLLPLWKLLPIVKKMLPSWREGLDISISPAVGIRVYLTKSDGKIVRSKDDEIWLISTSSECSFLSQPYSEHIHFQEKDEGVAIMRRKKILIVLPKQEVVALRKALQELQEMPVEPGSAKVKKEEKRKPLLEEIKSNLFIATVSRWAWFLITIPWGIWVCKGWIGDLDSTAGQIVLIIICLVVYAVVSLFFYAVTNEMVTMRGLEDEWDEDGPISISSAFFTKKDGKIYRKSDEVAVINKKVSGLFQPISSIEILEEAIRVKNRGSKMVHLDIPKENIEKLKNFFEELKGIPLLATKN